MVRLNEVEFNSDKNLKYLERKCQETKWKLRLKRDKQRAIDLTVFIGRSVSFWNFVMGRRENFLLKHRPTFQTKARHGFYQSKVSAGW